MKKVFVLTKTINRKKKFLKNAIERFYFDKK